MLHSYLTAPFFTFSSFVYGFGQVYHKFLYFYCCSINRFHCHIVSLVISVQETVNRLILYQIQSDHVNYNLLIPHNSQCLSPSRAQPQTFQMVQGEIKMPSEFVFYFLYLSCLKFWFFVCSSVYMHVHVCMAVHVNIFMFMKYWCC